METAQEGQAEGSRPAWSLLWGLPGLPRKWALAAPDTDSQGVRGSLRGAQGSRLILINSTHTGGSQGPL